MLNLINKIQDISKIEAGKMGLNCEHFTIKEVFCEIESLIYPISTKKNLSINTKILPDDIEIYGDKTKFKQIMYNLLNNAVKFTPEGENICISAEYDGDYFAVEVTDTGIGIAQHEIISQPFKQVDSAESRKYQGTGLALVKQFAEMHGASGK